MIFWKGKKYIKSKTTFANMRENEKECRYFVYFENRTYELKGKVKGIWEKVLSGEIYELNEAEESVLLQNLINRGWVNSIEGDLHMVKASYTILEHYDDKYFLFNTLFGNLEYCSKEVYDALRQDRIDELGKKTVADLYRKNYISYRNQEEYEQLIISDAYYTVYFIFSYACNMACVYCFETEKKKGRMGEETFIKACEYVDRLSKIAKVEIAFYGGEPLLEANREYIKRTLFRFSGNKNVFFKFITNGINVMKYMDLFLSYKEKIRDFVITIDGPEGVHDKKRIMGDGSGTYMKAMEAVSLLTNNGFGVTIRINLDYDTLQEQCKSVQLINKTITHKENVTINIHQVHYRYSEKHETVDLLECFKLFVQLKDQSEIPVVFVYPFYDVYERTINKYNTYPYIWQGFCKTKMYRVIDIDGKVYPCSEAMLEDKLNMGEVWSSNLKYPADEMKCVKSECLQCDYYLLCYGKCTLQNYIDNNVTIATCNKEELRKVVREFVCDRGLG